MIVLVVISMYLLLRLDTLKKCIIVRGMYEGLEFLYINIINDCIGTFYHAWNILEHVLYSEVISINKQGVSESFSLHLEPFVIKALLCGRAILSRDRHHPQK